MGRAGGPAGGGAAFADGIGAGDGLGIFLESGPAAGQTLVIFVGQLDGADLGALTAGRALGQIDETGVLPQTGREISRFPVQPQDFRIGQEFDVQVPADLDQLG
jgi:hypothetical protein